MKLVRLKLPITILGRNAEQCQEEIQHPSLSRQHVAFVHAKRAAPAEDDKAKEDDKKKKVQSCAATHALRVCAHQPLASKLVVQPRFRKLVSISLRRARSRRRRRASTSCWWSICTPRTAAISTMCAWSRASRPRSKVNFPSNLRCPLQADLYR